MGYRANEMSRSRKVAQMRCRADRIMRSWNNAQMRCRATEKSHNWKVAQMDVAKKKVVEKAFLLCQHIFFGSSNGLIIITSHTTVAEWMSVNVWSVQKSLVLTAHRYCGCSWVPERVSRRAKYFWLSGPGHEPRHSKVISVEETNVCLWQIELTTYFDSSLYTWRSLLFGNEPWFTTDSSPSRVLSAAQQSLTSYRVY